MSSRSKPNANPSPLRRSTRTTKGQPAITAVQTAHGLPGRRGSISSQTSTVDRRDTPASMLPTPPVSLLEEPLARSGPRTRKAVPLAATHSPARRATHGRPRANSQRSDQLVVPSPAKADVEPIPPWPPVRKSRATRTPEVQSDYDEAEVERSLIRDQTLEEPLANPPLETGLVPRQWSIGKAVLRVAGWPVMLLLAAWAVVWVLLLGQTAWEKLYTPFVPQIPLRYTAWAVASSAERLYPIAQPVLHITPMIKEIQPQSLSLVTSIGALKPGPSSSEAIQAVESYIKTSMAYQNDVLQVSTRVEADFDNTRRDLSTARKLILRLLPHRQESSLPRNFEAEDELIETLSRLHTQALPFKLQHLVVRLFELSQQWNILQGSFEALKHSATALAGQDAGWARLAGTVAGLHARMHDVHMELMKAGSAVEHWQRDLGLFKDPKGLAANYSGTNSSLGSLVERMNSALEQLNKLRRP